MTPPLITIIGGLDVDLIMTTPRLPSPGESLPAATYLSTLGGKGANSAIAAHRSSHNHPPAHSNPSIKVKLIGALGSDRHAPNFITKLNANGIDTSAIITVPHTPSSVCFVIIEHPSRENRCLFFPGATAHWRKEDFTKPEHLGGGEGQRPDLVVAQMEIAKEVVETMIETAGRAGIDFCLNAAPASPISHRLYRYLTHFIVNESEAAIMSGLDRDDIINKDSWGTIAQVFLERGVRNVVITLGAKGAFYANADGSAHCPAYDVIVRDTTGAGDTFTGAYCSEYLRQKANGRTWDIRSAVIRANKAAAMTVMRVGAQEGIPWAEEIDGFDAPMLLSS